MMKGRHCIVGMQSQVLDPLRRTGLLKQLNIGWRSANVKVVAYVCPETAYSLLPAATVANSYSCADNLTGCANLVAALKMCAACPHLCPTYSLLPAAALANSCLCCATNPPVCADRACVVSSGHRPLESVCRLSLSLSPYCLLAAVAVTSNHHPPACAGRAAALNTCAPCLGT